MRLLLRQLQFAFQTTDALTSILSLRERRTTKPPGEGQILRPTRDVDLESQARELLRSLGVPKLAGEIRVEWNPRLKTCAGRADYREKLISLNPLLRDHDLASVSRQSGPPVGRTRPAASSDIDRTLRHELAHLLAQWRV